MSKHIVRKIIKWTARIFFGLLLLIFVLIGLLYIPGVQNFVKDKALAIVNDGGDLNVSVDYFRLKFPLNVDVEGVKVLEKNDTMLVAQSAKVDVEFWPLLKGTLKANDVAFENVLFKLGTPDSITYVRAEVDKAEIIDTDLRLNMKNVDIHSLKLKGGRIDISLKPDTTPPTPPSPPTNMKITARAIMFNDLDFRLSLPTGEVVETFVDAIAVDDASVDLLDKIARVANVEINRVDASYIIPQHPVIVPEVAERSELPVDSVPWTIEVNKIRLNDSKALYALEGAKPAPGLDTDYLKFNNINLAVDSFFNQGAIMDIRLDNLSAVERCGLPIKINGIFTMTQDSLRAKNFLINTDVSHLSLEAMYGLGDTVNPPLYVNVRGDISLLDIATMLPDLKPQLKLLPQNRDIDVDLCASGALNDLLIENVAVDMRNYFSIKLKGHLIDLTDPAKIKGDVSLNGSLPNINFVKPLFMTPQEVKTAILPPLTLRGTAKINGKNASGNFAAATPTGKIALDADWRASNEGYKINFTADRFPLNSFLPGIGVGEVSATVNIDGNGFNPFSTKTALRAQLELQRIVYNEAIIKDIALNASLRDGKAHVVFNSDMKPVEMRLAVDGAVNTTGLDLMIDGNIRQFDLHALGLTDSASTLSSRFSASIKSTPTFNDINAVLGFSSIDLEIGDEYIVGSGVFLTFDTSDSLTEATLVNRDLSVDFKSPCSLDSLVARFSETASVIDTIMTQRHVDVQLLQRSLPRFDFAFRAGPNNMLAHYLDETGIFFRKIDVTAANDSLISVNASVHTFVSGSTKIDAASVNIEQHGRNLRYRIDMDNEPGTMDNFAHVHANGYLADDKLGLFLKQQNIKGETGFNIGMIVAATDTTYTLKIAPFTPTIGYRQWTVNKDNFISINPATFNVDANLEMRSETSSLHIYTSHRDDADHTKALNVDLDDIKIQEWISLNPFAPPMTGNLSTKINVSTSADNLNGQGTVTLADFTYNKKRVGTFDFGFDLSTNKSGAVYADSRLQVDGAEVLRAYGNLNDTASVTPFNLDVDLIRFPLAIANPFLAPTATLEGTLNGEMDASGSLSAPKLNGFLRFDSAAVTINMLGSKFTISDTKIPVDENVVRFNDFNITGANSNPLYVNGLVDLKSFTDVGLDVHLRAHDMMVVNSPKKKGREVYGKALIDLTAAAFGKLNRLTVDANLTILPGTNVTYVLLGGAEELTAPSTTDMVHFVNFSDSLAVLQDEELENSSAISLNATLNIEEGTTIGVDLSTDGQNRAQVEGNGRLEFTQSFLGDTRLTGRYTINSGFVRYTPPLMSEKLFNFVDGSYIAFNGNILDPRFSIRAIDRLRANVTQEGQNSRLIYFDVELSASGSLNNMDVAFDLSTDDDITVENELQSMSPDQRASQAMNLLLYNVYTGPGTKATTNLSGNPLFSFIESTVNSWMANNIKGVDISFGIDQYDRTVDGYSSSTMSYSYQVSKTLFNDRFKIIVGGNYSTDANADENFSQNLISDISFEYMLNKKGTMLIRLFRHTGYESILEGEITETGVGFVYKQKLRTLRDLFRLGKKSPASPVPSHNSIHSHPNEHDHQD